MPPLRPRNWPADVDYLTAPRHASTLPSALLAALRSQRDETTRQTSVLLPASVGAPATCVKITSIVDRDHPAFGQHGLFAAQNLPPDSFIVQYLGLVHDREHSDPASDYDLSLDRDLGVAVDATNCGNEARFINDYRGIRDQGPNAEFRDCWIEVSDGIVEKRIGVYVLTAGKAGKRAKGVTKGEEILVSYGKGFWSSRRSAE